MKKVGVPFTPLRTPLAKSARTRRWKRPFGSIPAASAYWILSVQWASSALAQDLVAVAGLGFHLPLDHLVVHPPRAHQARVRPALDDRAVLHQQDQVRATNRRQAMRDDERRAIREQIGHRRLNELLALRVEVSGRRLQNENLRLRENGPRDGQALLLSSRQFHPALADERVIALRQPRDEFMGIRSEEHTSELQSRG